MTKNEARVAARIRAGAFTVEYKSAASEGIASKLTVLEWFIAAGAVFSYVSTESEPSTEKINRLITDIGKRLALPKCGKKPNMRAVCVPDTENLVKGKYGIPEPREAAPELALTENDIVLVPCVCADRHGLRLGHGAGYYDAFLSNCPAYKVCLCYEEMLMDNVPADEHDIGMDCVITEKNIYYPDGGALL